MSARPISEKKIRRVAKALRVGLPAYFDLPQWLIDHNHARTKREAIALVEAKRVQSGSHPVGQVVEVPLTTVGGLLKRVRKVVLPVPAGLRAGLVVLPDPEAAQ